MSDDEDDDVLVAALLARRGRRRQAARLLLLEAVPRDVEMPLVPDVRFDFRFDAPGIGHLVVGLQLPAVIVTSERDRVNAVETLCIVLYRLSFLRRYADSMDKFGRSTSAQSRIFPHVIELLYEKWADHLYFPLGLVQRRLSSHCRAIRRADGSMDSGWLW
jgi:hypothetical protein